jgi:hypothetical protein
MCSIANSSATHDRFVQKIALTVIVDQAIIQTKGHPCAASAMA